MTKKKQLTDFEQTIILNIRRLGLSWLIDKCYEKGWDVDVGNGGDGNYPRFKCNIELPGGGPIPYSFHHVPYVTKKFRVSLFRPGKSDDDALRLRVSRLRSDDGIICEYAGPEIEGSYNQLRRDYFCKLPKLDYTTLLLRGSLTDC